MKTLNIFHLVIYWTQKAHNDFMDDGVLIHESYPDVWLLHSWLRGDLPSRCLQLLQWPLVSLLGVPDHVVTRLMPFMNFLAHSHTCCSDRHALQYWTFIRRWISMGFTPSLLKKTDNRTLFFFGACCKGAANFTLLLRRRVTFLHRTAICWPLFKPSVSLLSAYKTIELWFEFLSRF